MRQSKGRVLQLGVITLAVFLSVGSFSADAQEMKKMSGTMNMNSTVIDSIVIGDIDNHVILLAESKGTNSRVDGGSIFDGARAINTAYIDILNGSGAQQGYLKFTKGTSTAYFKWTGTVTTVMGESGKPVTSFKGTFNFTHGTGEFEKFKGSGTYQGCYNTPSHYTATWEGEYSIE